MSAQPKPELVRSAHDEQIDALIKKAELDGHIINALNKKNERLAAEKLEVELEASIEVAKAKFAAAQAHQLIAELRASVTALDESFNNQNNVIAGLVRRDEFEEVEQKLTQVASDYYSHSARSNC
jgi:hypothetical protein